MKGLVAATLLTCATAPASLFFTQSAYADTVTNCYPVIQTEVIQNPADHPSAYADGYSEGRQSARKGEAYQPRTVGGEFGRGFEDGYWGRGFTGQDYAVPNRVREFTAQHCDTYTTSSDDDRRYSERDRRDVRREINRIYQEELGRDADPKGLRTFQRAYENGWSLERIRDEIDNSEEGQNRW